MPPPARDREPTDGLLRKACEEAIRFLAGLGDRPVNNARPLGPLPALLPRGVGADAALTALLDSYAASFTASAGPRYFGFVTGGSTPAALAGDWLTSAVDQNASDTTSLAAAHIEASAVSMLRALLHLPFELDGRFVSGATMSNFVGLAIGRQWWGRQQGLDVAGDGTFSLPRMIVLSGSPHSCIEKNLSMLGVGRSSLHRVRTLPGREAVDVAALRDALRTQAGRPCLVVANAGVVNTADFDDIAAMVALRREHPFYLHVDAAFGGFAACSPRYRPLLDGWEHADSIAIDVHKWLNAPYDSGVQFTRHTPLQAEVFHNAGAAYLGGPNVADALHLTPENSRRLRALPAWMTLMAYGADGYREIVESSCRCAAWLGERIAGSSAFRLLAPVRMNVVAFTLKRPNPSPEEVASWLARLRDDGGTYLTPTVWDGVPGARAAFSNWRTTIDDVEVAWRSMNVAAGVAV